MTWFYSTRSVEGKSFSYGLTIIGPFGALLGLIGSLIKEPMELSPDAGMVS